MAQPLHRLARTYRLAFAGLGREVWLLAGNALVNRAGTMILPFLSLYVTRRLGMTTLQAGQILALYGVGSVVGSWLGGWLADRIGALPVQLLPFVASGFAYLALGQMRSFTGVAATVLIAAVIADAHRPAMMAAVAHFSEPPLRARAFALIRLAINLGMAIGPAIGGLLAVRHYGWLFVGDAVTCWAAAVLLVLTLGMPSERIRRDHGTTRSSVSPWRDFPFVVFLFLIFVLAVMFLQIWSTMPLDPNQALAADEMCQDLDAVALPKSAGVLRATSSIFGSATAQEIGAARRSIALDLGLDLRSTHRLAEPAIGALFAANALLIVLFEMVLVRALEGRDALRVCGIGAALVGAGLGALAVGRGLLPAVASMLLWTLGEMLSLPVSNALVALRAPADRTGAYMGAYTMAFAMAFVFAPIIGTAVYQRWGGDVLWPALAVLGVTVGFGFTCLRGPLGHPRPRSGE